ncbi:MAG: outer membrane beta-barrel protein [Gemmatimonadetes bacterium]|nr:outer membrane beta-barrel protein [Gemmatimonadota bacterium]
MRRSNRSALLLAFLLAAPLRAQSGTLWSLQASGLYVGLSGDAYSGLDAGVGAEGQLRYNFVNGWSLGAGVQASRHKFSEDFGLLEDLTLMGAFVEPRKVLPIGRSKVAPYLSGRLALLSQRTKVLGESVGATGLQVNAGGGLLFSLSPRANLDFGATVGAVGFGKYANVGSEAGSGSNFVMRVGLSLGLGK